MKISDYMLDSMVKKFSKELEGTGIEVSGEQSKDKTYVYFVRGDQKKTISIGFNIKQGKINMKVEEE